MAEVTTFWVKIFLSGDSLGAGGGKSARSRGFRHAGPAQENFPGKTRGDSGGGSGAGWRYWHVLLLGQGGKREGGEDEGHAQHLASAEGLAEQQHGAGDGDHRLHVDHQGSAQGAGVAQDRQSTRLNSSH